MKIKIFIFVSVLFLLAVIDCSKKTAVSPSDVQTAASTLTVAVEIMTGGGMTNAVATLVNSSTPVTGATININGTTLSDAGSGDYEGTVTTINAGTTVTLSITSSAGNASASAAMPTAGNGTTTGITTVSITGAAAGSIMMLENVM